MVTNIYATMRSETATPRIPSSELRAMRARTIEELQSDAKLRKYVLGVIPESLSRWKKTVAIKLILNGRKFEERMTNELKNVLIKFVGKCVVRGIDFRTLDIPKICQSSSFMNDLSKLDDYLIRYSNACDKLLHVYGVPIHLVNDELTCKLDYLESLVDFFSVGNNRLLRNAVIGYNKDDIAVKLSDIDLPTLRQIVPENVINICTFPEVIDLDKIARTSHIMLMNYYKEHSMFDTAQPEIYISRLKGLIHGLSLQERMNTILNQAKSITKTFREGVSKIASYASAGTQLFADFFSEVAVKGDAISRLQLRVMQYQA